MSRMTGEQAAKAFALRMALSQAGIAWWPCTPDGERGGFQTVSEAGINFLVVEHPELTATGIYLDGVFTLVDAVPLTEAQLEAKRIAEEEERSLALIAEEAARKEALVEDARARERQRKEEKRRAQGKPTRAQWLASKGAVPWVEAGVSRRTWYRQRKAGG
jgi:hypothetical protein